MINVRSETLTKKPAYKNLIQSKRCVIKADGYYEWMKASQGENHIIYMNLRKHTPIFRSLGSMGK